MPGVNYDTDSVSFDRVIDGKGYLFCQAFLDLQSPCVHIDKAGKFAHAEYFAPGNIPYMTSAEERKHVMFTETINFYISYDDHARCLLFEPCLVYQRIDVGLVARSKVGKRLSNTFGCSDKPFPAWVFTDFGQ